LSKRVCALNLPHHFARFPTAGPATARAIVSGVGVCQAEAPAKTGSDGPPPARVSVGQVRSGSVAAQWSFRSDVSALQRARLAPGASGEVRRVLVRVGDRVKRGDLLVEVDSCLAAARVRAAAASKEAGAARCGEVERRVTGHRRGRRNRTSDLGAEARGRRGRAPQGGRSRSARTPWTTSRDGAV
jgi:HlyD family secretion protein